MKAGQLQRAASLDFADDARLIERALCPESYLRRLRVALVSLLDGRLYRPQRSGIHDVPPTKTSGARAAGARHSAVVESMIAMTRATRFARAGAASQPGLTS